MTHRIIQIHAENIKKLKAINIKPDPNQPIITIAGKNEAGKTSVLDAIEMAFAGADSIPEMPIRKGEESGRIVLDLGDLIVKRTFTEKGSRLVVETKEGAVHKAPQAILDKLTGKLSFDPLAFMRQKPKDQCATLMDMLGLNFAELDVEADSIYENRRIVNGEVKAFEARSGTIAVPEGTPSAPVDVVALVAEYERLEAANKEQGKRTEEHQTALSDAKNRLMVHKQDGEKNDTELKAAMIELESLQKTIKVREDEKAQNAITVEEGKEECGVLMESLENQKAIKLHDTTNLSANVVKANAVNKNVELRTQKAAIDHGIKDKMALSTGYTAALEGIEAKKKTAISEAKFPVDGLSFDKGSVLYKGVPLSQSSSAEAMSVSVAMGIAMNPDLRIMLIRDGSLLDDDHMEALEKMAAESDLQVWLEKVGDAGSVVIEDGEIKEA